MSMRPRAKAEDGRRQRTPYQWVIEGDIKGCFDNIDHHRLMERVRARVTDGKLTRLIGQFLRAGVLSDGFLLPTNKGTPQGGVISPLLANVALGVIEERYERWTHHRRKIPARRKSDAITAAMWARMTDRKAGRAVFFPIRYADDANRPDCYAQDQMRRPGRGLHLVHRSRRDATEVSWFCNAIKTKLA